MSMTICPKCEYQRKPTDTAPDYECPRCGVIYAKARSRLAEVSTPVAPSPPQSQIAERVGQNKGVHEAPERKPKWIDDRQNKVLIASVAVSLVVGYFAGREHIKYELRSAFEDAAQGVRRAFSGENPSRPPASKPSIQKEQPVTPTLLRKGFREGEYGRNAITFTVEFSNRTGKGIRAFDGTLVFTDLLGNEINSAKLAVNDPIAAGATYSWGGELAYNQFIAAHERLKGAEIENMKVILTTRKVLFSDGQTKEYE